MVEMNIFIYLFMQIKFNLWMLFHTGDLDNVWLWYSGARASYE